ncbi:MAG: hypothetical protein BWY31_03466 [Lentisphaerae bacterium ADurb.Bin242]|nr:MAG: hypothetical protein BWY31_03466 [Lentisphaerae bacterium ADurb.Bin242]
MHEKNYDFLTRMQEVFKPALRDRSLTPAEDEFEIDSNWNIILEEDASPLMIRAADDLHEFLFKSMKVCVGIRTDEVPGGKIILKTDAQGLPGNAASVEADEDQLCLTSANVRGVLFGVIYLEDVMRLRRAPFLKKGRYTHEPLARMRSTHSGSGLDDFPDWQLNAILHAGFTAIDVFVCGIDRTTRGYCNLNQLIEHAENYGLDVVLYSYLSCYKHPDEPDADAFFDHVYGSLFRQYPKAKAIHLVGESLEFPSRDAATVKKSEVETGSDGLQSPGRPTGYYPGSDYPAYIAKIRDTIHKAAPAAEVIFNTYNWGWAPLEARKKFLENFPEGVTLQVTYDIFKQNRRAGLACPVMDYSIFAEEPGFYFTSEVETAAALGIRDIRVTSNLAGTTWDFGCVPYVPVPFRWIRRMKILKKYLLEYGVNSFYDSHHYGWWPNPCNDLAKAILSGREPEDMEAFLRQLAARDYGTESAETIVETWRIWSNAMDHYVASNEDQYGPWRVGPAYPFLFQPVISRTMDEKAVTFPTLPQSYRGANIIKTLYHPYENDSQSPGPIRYPIEIRELQTMLSEWENGLVLLENALESMEKSKRPDGERLYALGKFIRNAIRTTVGIKKWWLANMHLQVASNPETMLSRLEEIESLADAEIANVKDTIPCVELDSRLGWEPRMEYVCDKWHLEWKLRQMQIAKQELSAYRKMILL